MLFTMLRRRTSFPYFYIGLGLFSLCQEALIVGLRSFVEPEVFTAREGSQLFGMFLRLAIWGSYMLVSQRVRATFIRDRKAMPPQPSQPPPLPK